MKNKTTILIETWRQTRIHRTDGQTPVAFCEFCGADTPMLAPEEAARFGNLSPREVYQKIGDGSFHFLETTGGAVFVCGNSLKNIQGENS